MSAEEQKSILDSWNRHIERNARSQKFATFSSVQEEDFRETFKRGIMAHTNLTKTEKLKILASIGL